MTGVDLLWYFRLIELTPAVPAEAASRCRRFPAVDAAVWMLIALLPLACRPDTESAFHAPKLAVLLVLAFFSGVWCWSRGPELARLPLAPPLAWTAAVAVSALFSSHTSLPALLLALGGVPLYWVGAGRAFASAVAGSAALESVILLLQYIGADPIRWLGWYAEEFANPRMRVYGTLGNPNFAAAWCCAALPLSYLFFVRRARTRKAVFLGWGLVALQVAAVLCTGSRAALLAISVEAAVLAVCDRRRWMVLTLLPVAALVLLAPGTRPLKETVDGRMYLMRAALGRIEEIPITGTGPGSFEVAFAHRQVAWLREHPQELRFAGPLDHAHNDYAEILTEYGPAGLAALLLIASAAIVRNWRQRTLSGTAPYLAALAGLAAVAAVDFPLHRPAEWSLFWLLLGASYRNQPSC